jgi:hypothetical protein
MPALGKKEWGNGKRFLHCRSRKHLRGWTYVLVSNQRFALSTELLFALLGSYFQGAASYHQQSYNHLLEGIALQSS